MSINIWENYDFEGWGKEHQEKIKEAEKEKLEIKKKFDIYLKLVKKVIINLVGKDVDGLDIDFEYENRKEIEVLLNRCSIFEIRLNDDFIVVVPDKWNDKINVPLHDLNTIGLYVKQLVIAYLIPKIKSEYVKRNINKLPEKLDVELNIDVSRIKSNWFTTVFNGITNEWMNSETANDVVIKKDNNNMEIEFGVDCGRYGYHRYNKVKINDRGNVSIEICELLEGSDVEVELEKIIKKRISIKD